MEKLFKTEHLAGARFYGIRFPEEVMSIVNPTTIRTTSGKEVEVHRKTTMLMSPFKWMKGTYGAVLGLPSTAENFSAVCSKLQNPNNAGYVGALISAVLSNSGCQHFPKVYGIFTGTAAEHTIDISDDYGEISERPWFSQNIGKLFDMKLSDVVQNHVEFRHTRCARTSLQLGDEVTLEDVSILEAPVVGDVVMSEMNRIVHDETTDNDELSDTSSVSTQDMFEIMSCACDESDDEEDEDDDESCEPFAWATFKNVPVQITLMEKCTGTLYELMMMNLDPEKHLAWMTQVMFALAYAQRNFSFTHNDLHANNVMYVPYDKEFLYYNCGSQLYKVPTFGYLIKIIDFERGIASIKVSGMKEPKVFMSDHYDLDEEAGGMFNYDAYYTPKYPEIKPNPSGDLVRLATSLYWDLFPEEDPNSRLCGMMKRWMATETGSIMFGKNDPHHDRYHGFELYKAIVRFCKDSAVPRKEIAMLKDLYGIESGGENVLLID